MASLNVRVYRATSDPTVDLFSDEARFSEWIGCGVLTTDHAASSYGQAVLVMDGVTYGPGDVEAHNWQVVDADTVYPEPEPEVFTVFRRACLLARLAR